MQNTGPDEAQAGFKIAGRNINNLSYADDTNLMAESKEELMSLLMKVKEESENVGLKLNIQYSSIIPYLSAWYHHPSNCRNQKPRSHLSHLPLQHILSLASSTQWA